jgi:metallo-beta-lactamase class B
MKAHASVLTAVAFAFVAAYGFAHARVQPLGAAPQAAAQNAQPSAGGRGQQCAIRPFHVFGPLYYVGLSDGTSFLFRTSEGAILLDPLDEGPAEDVRKNIESLGVSVKDIKIIIQSHAHADHIGGLAKFKEWSGATVAVMAEDAEVLADGGRSDFRNLTGAQEWQPIRADRILHDGERIELGGIALVAHLTPGHTKGCTTWSTVLEEGERKHTVAFICSMRINTGIPILKNPRYPTMADDFEKGFRTLRGLPVDMFFVSHGNQFGMDVRLARMAAGEGIEPFIDPQGYKGYLDEYESAFRGQLAREQSGGPPYNVPPKPRAHCP